MQAGKELFEILIGASNYSDKDKLKEHTQKVVKRCKQLENKWNNEIGNVVDCELLVDSAWLHDIGKLKKHNGKFHHLPHAVLDVIEGIEEESKNRDWLEIIAHHKGDFKPTNYPFESAILRLCDKIDHLRQATKKKKKRREKAFSKAKAKCKDTLKLFRQYGFDETEMDILKDFYKKYRDKYRKQL